MVDLCLRDCVSVDDVLIKMLSTIYTVLLHKYSRSVSKLPWKKELVKGRRISRRTISGQRGDSKKGLNGSKPLLERASDHCHDEESF